MSKNNPTPSIFMPGPEHTEIIESGLGEILGAGPLTFAEMVPSAVLEKPGST